jgi:hypothetical protein
MRALAFTLRAVESKRRGDPGRCPRCRRRSRRSCPRCRPVSRSGAATSRLPCNRCWPGIESSRRRTRRASIRSCRHRPRACTRSRGDTCSRPSHSSRSRNRVRRRRRVSGRKGTRRRKKSPARTASACTGRSPCRRSDRFRMRSSCSEGRRPFRAHHCIGTEPSRERRPSRASSRHPPSTRGTREGRPHNQRRDRLAHSWRRNPYPCSPQTCGRPRPAASDPRRDTRGATCHRLSRRCHPSRRCPSRRRQDGRPSPPGPSHLRLLAEHPRRRQVNRQRCRHRRRRFLLPSTRTRSPRPRCRPRGTRA